MSLSKEETIWAGTKDTQFMVVKDEDESKVDLSLVKTEGEGGSTTVTSSEPASSDVKEEDFNAGGAYKSFEEFVTPVSNGMLQSNKVLESVPRKELHVPEWQCRTIAPRGTTLSRTNVLIHDKRRVISDTEPRSDSVCSDVSKKVVVEDYCSDPVSRNSLYSTGPDDNVSTGDWNSPLSFGDETAPEDSEYDPCEWEDEVLEEDESVHQMPSFLNRLVQATGVTRKLTAQQEFFPGELTLQQGIQEASAQVRKEILSAMTGATASVVPSPAIKRAAEVAEQRAAGLKASLGLCKIAKSQQEVELVAKMQHMSEVSVWLRELSSHSVVPVFDMTTWGEELRELLNTDSAKLLQHAYDTGEHPVSMYEAAVAMEDNAHLIGVVDSMQQLHMNIPVSLCAAATRTGAGTSRSAPQPQQPGVNAEQHPVAPRMPSTNVSDYTGPQEGRPALMQAAIDKWRREYEAFVQQSAGAEHRRQETLVRCLAKIKVLEYDAEVSLADWLHSTRQNIAARDISHEHTQVTIAATYLRGAFQRRWETAKSVVPPATQFSWLEFANVLLTSEEGKHPAEMARKDFLEVKPLQKKTPQASMHHYREKHERMLEHCRGSYVESPNGYDLVQHLLAYAAAVEHTVSMAVQQSYAVHCGDLLNGVVDTTDISIVGPIYAHAFTQMLRAGIIASRVVQARHGERRDAPDHRSNGGMPQKRQKKNGNSNQQRSKGGAGPSKSGKKPEKQTNSNGGKTVVGLKAKLQAEGIDLTSLHFDSHNCWYCGKSGHSAKDCRANLAVGSMPEKARTVGRAYFTAK